MVMTHTIPGRIPGAAGWTMALDSSPPTLDRASVEAGGGMRSQVEIARVRAKNYDVYGPRKIWRSSTATRASGRPRHRQVDERPAADVPARSARDHDPVRDAETAGRIWCRAGSARHRPLRGRGPSRMSDLVGDGLRNSASSRLPAASSAVCR
jgi:hypothetical protein